MKSHMEEKPLLHVIQQFSEKSFTQQKTICVGFEAWVEAACLYVMSSKSFKKSTLEALHKKKAELDFFRERDSFCVISLDALGKKEVDILKRIEEPLCLFARTIDKKNKEELSQYTFIHPQKIKPWEVPTLALNVVRYFFEREKLALNDQAQRVLSEILVQKPSFFASEMEKYRCFSHSPHISENGLEELFCHEKSSSLWKLFDAFVVGDKKNTFSYLRALEEEDDVHPLQLLRFFRSQWEKLLLISESDEVPAYASQKQKLESFRRKSFHEKRYVLEQFLLYDKKLREGEVEETRSLIPLFISLMDR